MTDQIPDSVNYLLLVLLYLFFGRVLWAVWSEVRTPSIPRWTRHGGSPSPRHGSEKGAHTFVVIEPRADRGRAFTLSSTLTIGREECDIVLEGDSFISSRHARIEIRPDGAWLVDLASTNGTYLNGTRISEDRMLRKGDRIQVGSAVLELRR